MLRGVLTDHISPGDVDLCGETILGNEKFIAYRQKSELEKKKYKEAI